MNFLSIFRRQVDARIAFSLFIFAALYSCKKDATVKPQVTDLKAELLPLLNALRARGCMCGSDTAFPAPAVAWNDSLEKAAADHAMDMYNKNYFNHISPSGVTPDDWARMEGYDAIELGEDIAENYATAGATFMAWQNSPDHCTIIMDTSYQNAGAAQYGNYWVLLLGRR